MNTVQSLKAWEVGLRILTEQGPSLRDIIRWGLHGVKLLGVDNANG